MSFGAFKHSSNFHCYAVYFIKIWTKTELKKDLPKEDFVKILLHTHYIYEINEINVIS